MANTQRLIVLVLMLLAAVSSAAQSGLAGKWTGAEQEHPAILELAVKGEVATGTVSIGQDPVHVLGNGKVKGNTVTFTTAARMNGRDITITWRGELKDDRLTLKRQLGDGPEMSPLNLRRAAP
jgi:hypothetical protein